jgi:hypothetical protein
VILRALSNSRVPGMPVLHWGLWHLYLPRSTLKNHHPTPNSDCSLYIASVIVTFMVTCRVLPRFILNSCPNLPALAPHDALSHEKKGLSKSFPFYLFRTLLLHGAQATLFLSILCALFLSPWGCTPTSLHHFILPPHFLSVTVTAAGGDPKRIAIPNERSEEGAFFPSSHAQQKEAHHVSQ